MDTKFTRTNYGATGHIKIGGDRRTFDLRWLIGLEMLVITLVVFGKPILQVLTIPRRWRLVSHPLRIWGRLYWGTYRKIEQPILDFADWALSFALDHADWTLRPFPVTSMDCDHTLYTAQWVRLGGWKFQAYRGSYGEDFITEVILLRWTFTRYH